VAAVPSPSADPLDSDLAPAVGPSGDEVAAATRPAGAPLYTPWWKVWLPVPLILLLLDAAFPFYFWRIPKLSGTSDDYSYQFLYDLHDLQTHRPPGLRMLAFGSSVTSAFDPYQIAGLLERDFPDRAIEVRRILRPGSKPSDYHLLWQTELAPIRPDVMVPVFNLVDYINPGFERSLKPGIRYILPPWQTLKARYDLIPGFAEKVEMVVASVSNLYRFRKPIRSTIHDHAKLVRSWWRGGGNEPYGVYPDGYTKPRFGVPVSDELEYFVDPRWIDQRGRARLRFLHDGELLATRDDAEPGWHRISLSGVGSGAKGLLDVEIEGGWSPRADGDEDFRLLGVRLREGLVDPSAAQRRPPLRYPPVRPSDTKQLLRMRGARGEAYEKIWQKTLAADDDFGHRFRLYRKAKLERSRTKFAPTQEFDEMRKMVREMAGKGIRVVMINTPENPLLEGVVTSQFYRDYLAFFASIAASSDRISFIDLHDQLPPEDLNDWHHLNYVGQLEAGRLIASDIAPVIARAVDDRAGNQ